MPDLCPATLVAEHLACRRIAVSSRQPDVAPADLTELGRTGLEQRALELVELVVAGNRETEIDGARAVVVHVGIVNARRGAA